jgi:PTH1 family peptidyl-tRNA hydrolase
LGKIKLVVGLGNPGKKYEGTRHNIGRSVVEHLRGNPLPVRLCLPESFMNASGQDVAREAKRNGITSEEILVVLDEFQIPLRQMKILKSGSDGGHNGMQSVLECLGSHNVPRLRIGIGPLPPGVDPAVFVLERFSREEQRIVDQLTPEFENAVTTAIDQGLDVAMNKYNNRTL